MLSLQWKPHAWKDRIYIKMGPSYQFSWNRWIRSASVTHTCIYILYDVYKLVQPHTQNEFEGFQYTCTVVIIRTMLKKTMKSNRLHCFQLSLAMKYHEWPVAFRFMKILISQHLKKFPLMCLIFCVLIYVIGISQLIVVGVIHYYIFFKVASLVLSQLNDWLTYTWGTLADRHGPLTRYVKLRVVHALGMPGAFSPSPPSKGTVG